MKYKKEHKVENKLQDTENLSQFYAQIQAEEQAKEAVKQLVFPSNWANVFATIGGKTGIYPADEVMRNFGMAMDSVAGAGGSFQPGFYAGNINLTQINSVLLDSVFLGWGELSLLQQNAIVNIICKTMSDSMTHKWINIYCRKNGHKKEIEQIKEEVQRFKLKERWNEIIYKTFLLGTMYITPKLKNDDGDTANELFLSKAKIGIGELQDFYYIEPTWVVPLDFNMTNPISDNFYKPRAYTVFGQKIHESRIKRCMFIDPVNLLSPIYLFGGVPPIQIILPYIIDALNTKKEIVKITSRYNVSILKTNMNALANMGGKTGAQNVSGRFVAFNALRNNQGLFVIDEKEEFAQIQMNLSGLTDIQQQQNEFFSLISQIPISKLFGSGPRGLNATGEFDANNFNELININQESRVRHLLEWQFKLLQLNLWGKIIPDLTFDFPPIGELNETTQSQLKTEKVNRILSVAQAGAIDPYSVVEKLAKDEDLQDEFANLKEAEHQPEAEEMGEKKETKVKDMKFV